ncbi:MAG: riboflavin synthase [Deltaproteobacteria bacterium]|nr:riboflavin synthase [Deltaproteobacteria bacterium]
MFTGLVQAIGRIRSLRRGESGAEIAIETPFDGLSIGESVAVEGVCLTVIGIAGRSFRTQATVETLERTTLGRLAVGSGVNLERALSLSDRLGGHIVTGHVDGVGKIKASEPVGDDAVRLTFGFPSELAVFFARKGSVAVDGISLTVNGVGPAHFDVVLIPHTQMVTTLGGKHPGDQVNLEVDVVARYVLRSLELRPGVQSGVTMELLERGGYE